MEPEETLKEIDSIQRKLNNAFEEKNIETYTNYFDDEIKYRKADGATLSKSELTKQTKEIFDRAKSVFSEYYRIKSSFDDGIFTEKIARKSKLKNKKLLIFSKTQTIQTEEIYHWQKLNSAWKVIAIEVILEEIY